MKININTLVTVTLTAEGVEQYLNFHKKFGMTVTAPTTLRTELWDLMAIFGPEMYNGNPKQMFEENIIVLDVAEGRE